MTMKVRDLIERLLEFDLDKPVEIDGGKCFYGIIKVEHGFDKQSAVIIPTDEAEGIEEKKLKLTRSGLL